MIARVTTISTIVTRVRNMSRIASLVTGRPDGRHERDDRERDPGSLLEEGRHVEGASQVRHVAVHQGPDDDRRNHEGPAAWIAQESPDDRVRAAATAMASDHRADDVGGSRLAHVLGPQEEDRIRGEQDGVERGETCRRASAAGAGITRAEPAQGARPSRSVMSVRSYGRNQSCDE